MGNYLAVDLGAESGRAMLGTLDDNQKLQIQQLHRFPNGMIKVRGVLHWDVLGMYREMLTGITAAVVQSKGKVDSIAFDTWGVDFGLFDSRGMLIGDPIAYRDSRRLPAMHEFLKKIIFLVGAPRRGKACNGFRAVPLLDAFELFRDKRNCFIPARFL